MEACRRLKAIEESSKLSAERLRKRRGRGALVRESGSGLGGVSSIDGLLLGSDSCTDSEWKERKYSVFL